MKRFALFAGIGGMSTLLQFLLLALFIETRLTTEVVASALGYALSSLFNYWANYHYTFKSSTSHWQTLPKFALAVAIGLAVNTLLFSLFLHIFTEYLHFPWVKPYLVAQCLATGITLIVNFMVHKFWIYRTPSK